MKSDSQERIQMDLMETMDYLAFARNSMGLTEFQEAFKGTDIADHYGANTQ